MTLSEELKWRGFVNQTTFKDIAELDKAPISFYWGVDPSADSMHIGQLAMAMMIRHFINYGHRATLLVGGATGLIGDPDGKDAERELKSLEEISHNKASIAMQYRVLFDGLNFSIVDNYDWFKDINYLEFLRDVGKHFSMTQLLDRDFVQSRIGEGGAGISYAEFSYSLIQGYDFLHLYRNQGVTLQVAGADQWGNSISGVHLIRKLENKEAHVWTAPIIMNKTTGKKFGKSEAGALWLDDTKTTVYQFYQFWLNVDDEGAIDYVKIYTLLPRDRIEELEERHNAARGARIAQKTLAREVTTLVHGAKRCKAIERVTAALFDNSGLANLSNDELDLLTKEIPTVEAGATLVECLVQSGLASSNGEARRLIASGAVLVNGKKTNEDIPIHSLTLIKKGKNSFALVR